MKTAFLLILVCLLFLTGCETIPVAVESCYYSHGVKVCAGYGSKSGISLTSTYGK